MRDRTLIAVAALSLTCFASAHAQVAGSNSNAGDDNKRRGTMQIVKSCHGYSGQPGGFCEITESNLAQIPVNTSPGVTPPTGTANYYTQPFPISPPGPTGKCPSCLQGLVDSNVILDAGNGNRAIGRCTFDVATNTGVRIYTDGTGTLAGFSARLEISLDDAKVPSWFLTGPYVFKNTNRPPS
jgi:hypothetical protein